MATNGKESMTKTTVLAIKIATLIGLIAVGFWQFDMTYAKAEDVDKKIARLAEDTKVQIAGMEVLYLQAQIRNARQERRALIGQRNRLLDLSDKRALTSREKRRLRDIEEDIRRINEDIKQLQREQRERRRK